MTTTRIHVAVAAAAMTAVVLAGLAPGALAGSTSDNGVTLSWPDEALTVPNLGCSAIPMTVSFPTEVVAPSTTGLAYILISTPTTPEQVVASGRTYALVAGSDPRGAAPENTRHTPVRTVDVNVCSQQLTAGYGPYTLRFIARVGDPSVYYYGINRKEPSAADIAEATISKIVFNDGTVVAAPMVKPMIRCKKKSTGIVKKFQRKQCPSGWVRR